MFSLWLISCTSWLRADLTWSDPVGQRLNMNALPQLWEAFEAFKSIDPTWTMHLFYRLSGVIGGSYQSWDSGGWADLPLGEAMQELPGTTVIWQPADVDLIAPCQLQPSEPGTFATAGYVDAPGSAVDRKRHSRRKCERGSSRTLRETCQQVQFMRSALQ